MNNRNGFSDYPKMHNHGRSINSYSMKSLERFSATKVKKGWKTAIFRSFGSFLLASSKRCVLPTQNEKKIVSNFAELVSNLTTLLKLF